ncbi:hypothetical protein RHMOL_Rhmol04G0191500 [Rhododendron molle]|uniref:Uncharacterized protein n=1 Tax=Rhododendron molle TaxID=49168 RepID=A0ACC0P3E1_RHOML|nr:hypothetical protein RHMOL_Rhmol04G0191500 [Rhododendron molle]
MQENVDLRKQISKPSILNLRHSRHEEEDDKEEDDKEEGEFREKESQNRRKHSKPPLERPPHEQEQTRNSPPDCEAKKMGVIRDYTTRFNKELVQIYEVDDNVCITAYITGLYSRQFLYLLSQEPPKTLVEHMLRAQKHMNAEEVVYARCTHYGFEPQARPSPVGEFPQPDKKRYGTTPRSDPIGEIKVIHGGFVGGGESSNVRKAHLRKLRTEEHLEVNTIGCPSKFQKKEEIPIIFSEEDTKGVQTPHDDSLVITIVVANYLTRRVLIDSGSSADILYLL